MNQIDYSYIKYPDGSYGRIQGRRNEAWKLAIRLSGKPIEEIRQLELLNASMIVISGECKRITCSNWRKMHGLPMKRRKGRKRSRR